MSTNITEFFNLYGGITHIIVFVRSEEKGRQKDKGSFGARIKIVWEEQLVDPPIDYITFVNVPEPSVLN